MFSADSFAKPKEDKNHIFSTCKLTEPKDMLNIGFLSHLPFSQNLVPLLFTPPLPPIPISHQLSR